MYAFCGFEFMNFMCHFTLRNLRKPGSKERGIPKGWGFDFVACANYFQEALCWTSFATMSNTLFGWVFLVVSAGQMTVWALKKHQRYRKDFKDYPRGRKAMFPFLI